MEIKDSGERRKFETSAVRDITEGKGRMDLLPFRALHEVAKLYTDGMSGLPFRAIIEVAKLYEAGCLKYGDRNWEHGIPAHSFIDSGFRHLAKVIIGQEDEPHLVQAVWNNLCLLDTILRVREGVLPEELLDNLPFTSVRLSYSTYQWGELSGESSNKDFLFSTELSNGLYHLSQMMLGRTNVPHIVLMVKSNLMLLDTILRVKDGTVLSDELDELPFSSVKLMDCHFSWRIGEPEARCIDVPVHPREVRRCHGITSLED
jgi:hypothetical protein